MRRRNDYNDDPALANVPLSVEEVAYLIEQAPKDLRTPEALVHLLQRVYSTASTLRQVRLDADAELRRRAQILPAAGGATVAVNPEQAARFLSPEQLAKLFDRFAQERLAALEDARARAEASSERAAQFVDAIEAVCADPGIEEQTRARLQQMLSAYEGRTP